MKAIGYPAFLWLIASVLMFLYKLKYFPTLCTSRLQVPVAVESCGVCTSLFLTKPAIISCFPTTISLSFTNAILSVRWNCGSINNLQDYPCEKQIILTFRINIWRDNNLVGSHARLFNSTSVTSVVVCYPSPHQTNPTLPVHLLTAFLPLVPSSLTCFLWPRVFCVLVQGLLPPSTGWWNRSQEI